MLRYSKIMSIFIYNTEVTKTANRRLVAISGLQRETPPPMLKCSALQQKHVCLQPGTKSGFGLYR